MRYFFAAIMALSLAACDMDVAHPGSGVGFDSLATYQQKRAEREAVLQRGVKPKPTNAPTRVSKPAEKPAESAPVRSKEVAAMTPAPAPLPKRNGNGISDEQEFEAVSSRESIESDRDRLKSQRDQFVVIQPKDVPTGSSGAATVVNFALSTNNRVGEAIYTRSRAISQKRHERICHRYASPDRAQAAFLKAGGPVKDRKGVDPDGDGFACTWNPEPYRNARGPAAPISAFE